MNDLENIKQKLNIVDVVREYVPSLKKVGRNWSSISPFRNEKTPSFIVNEELGIWKDFGGDKAGDIITFVMEMENVDFRKALEICAAKAGVTLSGNIKKDPKEEKLKADVLRMNNYSAEVFHYIALKHKAGEKARKYIEKRGFSEETLKKYLIGYSPLNLKLQDILRYKLDKSIDDKLLITSGLFVEKYGHIKDKYQDRLMFPIRNSSGEIVGFSGRVIDKTDERPKYINSPETPVYKKSSLVFNLYEAKSAIKKADFVIVTEGQIDCIISTQAGVENIVAPLGTSLTVEQLKILKRYTDNICFCFNNDKAGMSALERGFRLCSQVGLNVKVIELPKEFKDIDELIQKDKAKWGEVSKKHHNFLEYLMKKQGDLADLKDTLQRKRFTNYILSYIKSITDVVEQVSYIQKLSLIVDIDEETLKEALKSQKNIIEQSISENPPIEKEVKKIPSLAEYKKNTYFIGLLLELPSFIKDHHVFPDLLEDPVLKVLLEIVIRLTKENEYKELDHTKVYEEIVKTDKHLEEHINNILLQEIDDEKDSKRDLDILYHQFSNRYKRKELGKLRSDYEKKERINIEELDPKEIRKILKEE